MLDNEIALEFKGISDLDEAVMDALLTPERSIHLRESEITAIATRLREQRLLIEQTALTAHDAPAAGWGVPPQEPNIDERAT